MLMLLLACCMAQMDGSQARVQCTLPDRPHPPGSRFCRLTLRLPPCLSHHSQARSNSHSSSAHWFFLLLAGMSFCLPVAYYKEWKDEQQKKKEGLEQPLLAVSHCVHWCWLPQIGLDSSKIGKQ